MHRSALRAALGASLFLCAFLAPRAAAQGETGLEWQPNWTVTDPGADFISVSATTRGALQSDPLVLNVPKLPPGTTLAGVFLSWNWLLDGTPPGVDTMTFNGATVFGLLKGQGKPDLGWGKQGGATYLAFASQSDLILGGPNVLKGVVDKPVGADPAAYGAGLTLIVVYRRAFGVLQRVDVWSGWSSTESSSTDLAEAKLNLQAPWIDGPAHLYLNALDGIDFVGANDELLLNGFSVGGDLDGTGDKTDAWRGLAGPQGASNLYDGLDDSIAAYMDVGDTAILALTDNDPGAGLDDTIGHTLAVFASIAQLGTSTTYCTAKVNSLGCTPDIWGVGVPSVDPTQGPFDIVVDELVNNANGILFWGSAPSSAPFQGGTLCIGGSVIRTDLQNSGGSPTGKDCSGTMGFDFNAYLASGVAPDLPAGTMVFAQYWTRDVDDPFGSSLSEALAFDLAP